MSSKIKSNGTGKKIAQTAGYRARPIGWLVMETVEKCKEK